MRVLIFTDLHAAYKAEFSKPTSDGYSEYLHRVGHTFTWIAGLVKDNPIDMVAFLGDLIDTTGYIETPTLAVVADGVRRLKEVCRSSHSRLVMLVGNHDDYGLQVNNLSFIDQEYVVSEPEIIHCCGVNVMFWPWMDLEKLRDAEFDSADVHAVMCHLDVVGAKLNAKKRSDVGLDPGSFGSIPVFNGHLHLREVLHKDPLWYNVGSVISRNFKDADTPQKGAVVATFDTVSKLVDTEFVPNPHDIPFITLNVGDEPPRLKSAFIRVKYNPDQKQAAAELAQHGVASRLEPIVRGTLLKIREDRGRFDPEQSLIDYISGDLSISQDLRSESLVQGLTYLNASKDQNLKSGTAYVTRLSIENFHCIGHADVDLGAGLFFVEGVNLDDTATSNGSGKSSLHEAIYWALTGKSLRKYTGDQVIKWGERTCKVELTVVVNGTEYSVIRYRRSAKYGNQCRVIDQSTGDELTLRRKTETDELLTEIFGVSERMLLQTVFMTSGLSNRFTSLSSSERVSLIEQIVGVDDYFAPARTNIRDDLSVTSAAMHNKLGSWSSTNGTLETLKDSLGNLDTVAEQERVYAQSQLSKYKEDLRKHISYREDLKGLLEKESGEFQALKSTVPEETTDPLPAMRERLEDMIAEEARLDLQIKNWNSLVEEGMCPTCLRPMLPGDLTDTDYGPTTDAYLDLQQRRRKLEEQINIRSEADRESRTAIKSLLSKQSVLRQLEAQIQSSDNQISYLKREMQRLRERSTDYNARREELQKLYDEALERSKKIGEEIVVLEAKVEVLRYLDAVFSPEGVRARVIFDQALPFLNERVNLYSMQFGQPCSLGHRVLKSGTQTEKIDVVLDKVSYKGLSSGETRKVDLAIQCALNDLSVMYGGRSVKLLVADEVIDPLDDYGAELFIQVLRSMASEDSTVLVSTHRKLHGVDGARIVVTKRDGTSSVEQVR